MTTSPIGLVAVDDPYTRHQGVVRWRCFKAWPVEYSDGSKLSDRLVCSLIDPKNPKVTRTLILGWPWQLHAHLKFKLKSAASPTQAPPKKLAFKLKGKA